MLIVSSLRLTKNKNHGQLEELRKAFWAGRVVAGLCKMARLWASRKREELVVHWARRFTGC